MRFTTCHELLPRTTYSSAYRHIGKRTIRTIMHMHPMICKVELATWIVWWFWRLWLLGRFGLGFFRWSSSTRADHRRAAEVQTLLKADALPLIQYQPCRTIGGLRVPTCVHSHAKAIVLKADTGIPRKSCDFLGQGALPLIAREHIPTPVRYHCGISGDTPLVVLPIATHQQAAATSTGTEIQRLNIPYPAVWHLHALCTFLHLAVKTVGYLRLNSPIP